MDKVKRVNVNINHGDAYFSDSVTVADNPDRFIFDFKQSSPRFDQTAPNSPEQQTTIVMKHNTIVVSSQLAKVLHEMLGERIKQHEKMFGKIPKPTKRTQSVTQASTAKPSYFG
jgi:hypothetical protein